MSGLAIRHGHGEPSNVKTPGHLAYRPDIDGLRAVAVLSVLLFHLDIPGIPGGFVGVDVFFVISGFLITSKIGGDLAAGRFSLLDFYLARVRRIAPAMFATLAVTFAVASVIYSATALRELAYSALAAIFSVSNVYFWMTSGYFDTAASSKALLHTWSLGVEEQFYLIWPIMVMFLYRSGRLFPVALATLLVSTFAAQYVIGVDSSAAYFLLPFRFGELALGGLIALMGKSRASTAVHDLSFLSGLVMIIAACLLYTEQTPFPGVAALLPAGGSALVIYSGAHTRRAVLLANRAAVGLGKISYSLYLIHWPMIVLTKYYLVRHLTIAEKVVLLVLMVLLSILSLRFVETPFRARHAGRFKVSTPTLVRSFAGSLAALCICLTTAIPSGWVWRIHSTVTGIDPTTPSAEIHKAYYGGKDCKIPRCETQPGSGKPVIYVLGDSHARALVSGLQAEMPDFNFVVFAPSSCLLVSDVYGTNRGSRKCNVARKEAFREMRLRPAPVILHQHWTGYFTYPIFNTESPAETVTADNPVRFGKFLSRMSASIGMLTRHPVIVLANIPGAGMATSPFDCVLRPLAAPINCSKASVESPFMIDEHTANQQFARVLNGRQPILDPFDFLCKENHCSNFDGEGRPIYSDTGHLSVWGARELVRNMRHELRDWVTGNKTEDQAVLSE